MKFKNVFTVLAATAVLIAVPAGAAVAEGPASPTETSTSSPMTLGHYDHEVAEASGFEIIVGADGEEVSVPVTPEAQVQVSASRASVSADPVGGLCGTSFVNAAKLSNDTLAVTTGYGVPLPVVEKSWQVNAISLIDQATIFFSSGSTGVTWSAEGAAVVVGPGIANVPLTSFVVMTSGAVCYSNGPTATFG